jgi:hypothetical protein
LLIIIFLSSAINCETNLTFALNNKHLTKFFLFKDDLYYFKSNKEKNAITKLCIKKDNLEFISFYLLINAAVSKLLKVRIKTID